MRTERIDRWLCRDFPGDARAAAEALVDRIGAELAAWRIVSESDRVEGAALTYADADLQKLAEAVELAMLDWRDLLVSAGDA